jgi:hypothetical protein
MASYLFLSIMSAILIPVLGAVLYYLGYFAKVTKWLWSRYPDSLSSFMRCAACSGTYYALIAGTGLWLIGFPFLGLPSQLPPPFVVPGFWLVKYVTIPVMALWGTYWIPVLANKHLAALQAIGEHEEAPPIGETHEEAPIVQQEAAELKPTEQPIAEPKTPEVSQEVTPDRRAKYKETMAKARAAKLAKKAAKGTPHGR